MSGPRPLPLPQEWWDEQEVRLLGLCCACRRRVPLRHIVALDRRAPESARGKGWGCVRCGLTPDGAMAAVCDSCLERGVEIVDACADFVTRPPRMPLDLYERVPFQHRPEHQEVDGQ